MSTEINSIGRFTKIKRFLIELQLTCTTFDIMTDVVLAISCYLPTYNLPMMMMRPPNCVHFTSYNACIYTVRHNYPTLLVFIVYIAFEQNGQKLIKFSRNVW